MVALVLAIFSGQLVSIIAASLDLAALVVHFLLIITPACKVQQLWSVVFLIRLP